MSWTVDDYVRAVPLGPVLTPPFPHPFARDVAAVDVEQVESRGSRVVATMRWGSYPHPVRYALMPEDVAVMGGYVPHEEATPDQWAEEASSDFAWGAMLPLLSSRRTWDGEAVELTDAERPDLRFSADHLLGTDPLQAWHDMAALADPAVPPSTVDRWRAERTLVSWHFVRLHHRHMLPVRGHGAARWVEEAVASIDHLAVSEGLPGTFALLTVAEVMHSAAGAGARTVICTVDVPRLEVLGFRRCDGALQVDTRFLDIDHQAIADLVRRTAGWTPPTHIQDEITRSNEATYYAG